MKAFQLDQHEVAIVSFAVFFVLACALEWWIGRHNDDQNKWGKE